MQEFRVDSNNYPAEQGTGTGGQINVLTKSGGKDFHGSLFEFFRNDALDAANFFDNSNPLVHKSPLRLNQFGGSVGGPIKKDKAFFFFSYEGYRLRGGINTIETVPGFASRICAPPLGTGTVACNATTAALIPGFRAPAAVSLRVGPDLFDTVQLQANNIVNENSAALRLDYRLNQKHSMYFRFFRDQGTNLQPDGVTGRQIAIRDVPQNGVIALQSLLSPTLLNEFKIGYNSALSRINGLAPTVNGIDFSNLAFNISGSVAGFALPGQGANAGVASPGGLIRANSAQNGRGQPYTPYSVSFVDNLAGLAVITRSSSAASCERFVCTPTGRAALPIPTPTSTTFWRTQRRQCSSSATCRRRPRSSTARPGRLSPSRSITSPMRRTNGR